MAIKVVNIKESTPKVFISVHLLESCFPSIFKPVEDFFLRTHQYAMDLVKS